VSTTQQLWDQAWLGNDPRVTLDLTNARVGGRATKANPNKEDVDFWQTAGPRWVDGYIAWRKTNPDWKIWTAPDGNPGIELGLTPVVGRRSSQDDY
jgi:hypothetical protein